MKRTVELNSRAPDGQRAGPQGQLDARHVGEERSVERRREHGADGLRQTRVAARRVEGQAQAGVTLWNKNTGARYSFVE